MQRYHPVLVALHWIMALMVVVALVAGGFVLENIPYGDPDRTVALAAHMGVGIAIGALLVLRLATRFLTRKPPPATTGNALLDRIGVWTHRAFYVLIAGMVLSGLATGIGAGLFPAVFLGETVPANVPDDDGGRGVVVGLNAAMAEARLENLPQYAVHEWIATALAALIALHVAAAVYHQAVLKDGLLRRMWFGKRG